MNAWDIYKDGFLAMRAHVEKNLTPLLAELGEMIATKSIPRRARKSLRFLVSEAADLLKMPPDSPRQDGSVVSEAKDLDPQESLSIRSSKGVRHVDAFEIDGKRFEWDATKEGFREKNT